MYNNVNIRVRVGGKLGDVFSSLLGVKQGDALSPLLFGLFIDRFEKYIDEEYPNLGVQLKDQLIRVLLYADDLVLLAESPIDLQLMLNALSKFSTLNSLTVNTTLGHPTFYSKGCDLARAARCS